MVHFFGLDPISCKPEMSYNVYLMLPLLSVAEETKQCYLSGWSAKVVLNLNLKF